MYDLILLGGPTASGKSRLAIELATHFGTCVISADSRQVYRGMDIGTAKPSAKERAAVPHYLIDMLELDGEYSAGRFEQDVLELTAQQLPIKRPLIVAGGTGLYLRTLWKGIDRFPDVPSEKKEEVIAFAELHGIEALQERLRKVDPQYARQVDLQNPHRLIRAIAVSEASGIPYSSLRHGLPSDRPFRMLPLLLEIDRELLYRKINNRVAAMMADGLEEEARRLWPLKRFSSLQTVGYQELFRYFDGEITLAEAVEAIKTNTRRYAKRQLTWFRSEDWWNPIAAEPAETLTNRVLAFLETNP